MSAAAPRLASPALVPGSRDGTAPGAASPVHVDARYVDEARTHHVVARVVAAEDGSGLLFVTVESPHAQSPQEDALVTRTPIRDAWEARFHQADLEGRLAQMGRYWRLQKEDRGWLPLRPHPGVPRVDLRAVEMSEKEGVVSFHPFHHGGGARDELLVAVPSATRAGPRYLLADLAFRFPEAHKGDLRILHERLAPGPLKSMLTREHMDFARRGYEKLVHPREFAVLYGPDWQDVMRSAFAETMLRIREGRTGPGGYADIVEGDPGTTDYRGLLTDKRLLAVHRRFLDEEEEKRLLAAKEVDVRRWIAQKRRAVEHASQHLLSLLEASLLARLALRHGSHVDPEAARQLRRLAFYL